MTRAPDATDSRTTLSGFADALLAEDGSVVFSANIDARFEPGGFASRGYFSWRGGALREVVTQGQPVDGQPGRTWDINPNDTVSVSGGGDVLFGGRIVDASGSTPALGHWDSDTGDVTPLLEVGDTVPGAPSGGVIQGFTTPAVRDGPGRVNDAGEWAVQVVLNDGDAFVSGAVIAGRIGSVPPYVVVDQKDTVLGNREIRGPSASTEGSGVQLVGLTPSGDLWLRLDLLPFDDPDPLGQDLPGGSHLVRQAVGGAMLSPGSPFRAGSDPLVNDPGDVLYRDPDARRLTSGIGDEALLATNDPASGLPGASVRGVRHLAMNGSGEAIVRFDSQPNGERQGLAYFAEQLGAGLPPTPVLTTPIVLALDGDPAPRLDDTATLSIDPNAEISNTGLVLFETTVRNRSGNGNTFFLIDVGSLAGPQWCPIATRDKPFELVDGRRVDPDSSPNAARTSLVSSSEDGSRSISNESGSVLFWVDIDTDPRRRVRALILGTLKPNAVRPCNEADLAPPFGATNTDDVLRFLDFYQNDRPQADVALPYQQLDFNDILKAIREADGGCP